jgi:hypothetical protein
VGTDPQGRRQISHTGGSIGGISILALYPDQQLVVAIVVNTDEGLNALVGRVANWYAEEAVPQ